ncbi:alpha-ketoglutarate-dependent dioxygenase alkB -like protein [Brachionus plicatilis]|uniref:Alpha-ketoglutarate-dependent dioxygenase alkB-like protein n=1 Tax=Brachionus plicatilis TaxID=10195 RepID=A0A3M7PKL7_BRAPC|nr:alpha-ketoglutarate-dependent dioxygenase alkB -like protein [Brachionus plicatilis]
MIFKLLKLNSSLIKCSFKTSRQFSSSVEKLVSDGITNCTHLLDSNDPEVLKTMQNCMIVKENFINEQEENEILAEVNPYMKRLRYEFDHWDNAIHGYRETERLKWIEENQKILNRVKQFAFDAFSAQDNTNLLNHIHILDLHEDGFIKPHVDAVRFCGNTIAGICLLSDAVMKLTSEKDKSKYGLVLLKRRCLYVMRDTMRYDYAHEVLGNSESFFKNVQVPKTRRISIICRNEPDLSAHPEKTN